VGVALLTAALYIHGGPTAIQGGSNNSDASGAPTTVAVSKGSVTEVLTLPATLIAMPKFDVPSTRNGLVTRAILTPGATVKAGQRLFSIGSEPVRSPARGTFLRWLVMDASDVGAGAPVAELVYPGFGESISLPPGAAYRLLNGTWAARANITGGPGPFECPLLQRPGDSQSAVAQSENAATGPTAVCAVPLDVRAYAGLEGTVAIQSGLANNVLVLPQEAIAGSAQRGEVTVVDKTGRTRIQEVGLGMSNGSTVEITKGLAEGDRVLSTAPALTSQLP
jgi:macrolide-specific efflux system membrane fusion protein